MSLDRNKTVIHRYFDEIMNGKNLGAAEALIAESCVFTIPTLPTPYYGPSGYIELVNLLRTAFPDLVFTIEDELAQGDVVVDRWTARGTHLGPFMDAPPSGRSFTIEGIGWYRLVDGQIVEATVSEDTLGLLTQIGAVDAGEQAPAVDAKAMVHRFFDEVWNHANDAVVDELLAPDFVEHFPGMKGGRDGFKETAVLFRAAFPDIELTIEDEIAEGDRVVHRWTWRCTHLGELYGVPATGRRVEFSGMTIVRVAGGMIAERWASLDLLGLLRQLGAVA